MKCSEAKKILQEHGARLIRQGKNHEIWFSEITGKKFQVPRHNAKELPIGTWNNIKNSAGIQ